LTKTPLIYIVFHVYILGAWSFVWGATPFPHQLKRKTAPNSSNKVSIRLQGFPHWIFPFHYRLLISSANLRVASTPVRSHPCLYGI